MNTTIDSEAAKFLRLFEARRYAEAEDVARSAQRFWPGNAFGPKALAAVYVTTMRHAEALEAASQALAINEHDPEVHNYVAGSLCALGRPVEAEAEYRRALDLQPNYAAAIGNLANLLRQARRWTESAEYFRSLANLKPSDPMVQLRLAEALYQAGRNDDALTAYRYAIALAPGDAALLNDIGNGLKELGRLAEAEDCYRRAMQIDPNSAPVKCNLGVALRLQGRLPEAEALYRQALRLVPGYFVAYCNLGDLLCESGRLEEAEQCYRNAIGLAPDSGIIHAGLGRLHRVMGRATDAVVAFRKAVALDPGNYSAHNDLGNSLTDLGEFEDAEDSYRRALAIRPDFAPAQSNLIFLRAYGNSTCAHSYLEEAERWERAVIPAETRLAAKGRRFPNSARAGRRLRIGYLSGDFRVHAVSYFIAAVLQAHDRRRVEVIAYSTNVLRDAMTERIQGYVDGWRDVSLLSDAEAAQVIGVDRIDILVDLSGHTAHNRLGIVARRAAPVQCHYLGFIGSTGLSEMDYFIADKELVPETRRADYCEEVWCLPRVWASYVPPFTLPEPVRQIEDSDVVRFGCFNHLRKVTRETIALWARILRRLPEARLALKTKELDDPGARAHMADLFGQHGIPLSRLELLGRSETWQEHMACYNRIDVALDPVGGHGGATTTCDALWMGVPVVTLAGGRYGERMSHALLTSIGRADWSTASDDAYVEKAVQLAADAVGRRETRMLLRKQIRHSPLADASGLARTLEDGYEAMFDRWFSKQSRKGKA